ncbi:MAG: methionyl-tRNA formyltransferase [Bacteroidales bacterium]|nr:methionyl-tRNA formyltransferase [Bacteroidales bacterium]
MRVVFMGTPEFAVATLDRIVAAGYDVAAVVTTPDKPAGRGQHLKCSSVKQYALEHNLPLLQPVRLRDEEFVSQLQSLHADVFVVVAFRMLPKEVYTIPPHGTFNVHASLLPQYRGAAPIQWAIVNGEKKTGVTTFFLDEHTDTGEIVRQTQVEIAPDDDGGSLHDKLMAAGAEIAVQTLRDIEQDKVRSFPQPVLENLKPAPKIFKEDMLIEWNDTAEHICDKIRGLSPYPGAFTRLHTFLGDKTHSSEQGGNSSRELVLKIFKASVTDKNAMDLPGTFSIENNKKLLVSAKNREISIEILQIEGKKRMKVEDFIAGFRFDNYTKKLF